MRHSTTLGRERKGSGENRRLMLKEKQTIKKDNFRNNIF